MLAQLWQRHQHHWSRPALFIHSFVSFGSFLAAILLLQPNAVEFATNRASNPVDDLFLSNVPVFEVGAFFVYGMFILIAFITFLCLWRPNRIPFVLYSLAIFVVIRAIFVSLTHIGPFDPQAASNFGDAITRAFFGADLFFSGHTGAPFLMALIFWREALLRYIFLAWSVFFGLIVLLGHLHYSIDVLAAFFITYGIFNIALWLMPGHWAFLHKS
jgi:hypothetical protein